MPHNMLDVKGAFAEYLALPQWNWSWFITQTFDDYKQTPYPKICDHSWRSFCTLVGKKSSLFYGWMFSERGKSGRLHWHALAHVTFRTKPGLDGITIAQVWDRMFHKYGRCQILEYKQGDVRFSENERHVGYGIGHYLTKYVAKSSHDGDATWDFTGFIDGVEATASRLCSAIDVPVAGY